jgi:hypothetical protein
VKRGGPLARYSRLSPRSKKREREAAERRIIVLAALARDRRSCQAAGVIFEVDCAGPLDPHEIIPRSAWAAGYLVLDNVITVCRAHHDWIGEHVHQAHAYGFHGYSWERPDHEPVTGRSYNDRTTTKEDHDATHGGAGPSGRAL